MYTDIHQPRYSVSRPDSDRAPLVVGQSVAQAEALFFCLIGYTVHVDRWNGTAFERYENYLPEDIQMG